MDLEASRIKLQDSRAAPTWTHRIKGSCELPRSNKDMSTNEAWATRPRDDCTQREHRLEKWMRMRNHELMFKEDEASDGFTEYRQHNLHAYEVHVVEQKKWWHRIPLSWPWGICWGHCLGKQDAVHAGLENEKMREGMSWDAWVMQKSGKIFTWAHMKEKDKICLKTQQNFSLRKIVLKNQISRCRIKIENCRSKIRNQCVQDTMP